MQFKLNPTRVKYSAGEVRAFSALSHQRRDTKKITEQYYSMVNKKVPGYGSVTVIGALRSLKRKAIRNKETFRIMNTKQNGPWPIEFWLEPRSDGR